jgi:pilus assembly protein FimV
MTRSSTSTVRPSRKPALSLVAMGIVLAVGSFSLDAAALSLGRLNVLSSLGEPLRAEVELSDLTAAEADGLRVRIPSADAFRAIGVPYNAALADVQATVQRRSNGRYVVQLTSSRQMAEPFMDVLLEANGSSGRVFRDYTVLIDPAGVRPEPAPRVIAAVPLPSSQPQVPPRPSRPANVERETILPAEVRLRPAAAAAPRPARPLPVPAAVAPSESSASRSSSNGGSGSGGQIIVRPGDTASRIANANKPPEVSLDQMLVALLRTNPDAFIQGNLNRVRAGAVMAMPSAADASALSPQEARRVVAERSRNDADYRQQLAASVPTVPAGTVRSGSSPTTPDSNARDGRGASTDRLTVAPGETASPSASAATPPMPAGSAATLGAAGSAAPASSAGAGWPAGAASDAAAVLSTPAASAADGSNPAAGAASSPVAVAPPVATGAAVPATAPPAPVASTPWYDLFFSNPLVLGGLALIGLLIAWLAVRLNGRQRKEAADSVFIESRLPKDSFFATSGGESVDTRSRGGSSLASSLSYSPSQVDAADVDPVAEADVYLAYGRDLQAEEILREALRANPERVSIHLKLLEIHAKRRDLRAYEGVTEDVRALTGATGADWARVMEMGRELDPGNPTYDAAGRTGTAPTPEINAMPPQGAAPQAVAAPPPAFVPSVAPLDFDLDLDRPLNMPVAPPSAPAVPPAPSASSATLDMPAPAQPQSNPASGVRRSAERFVPTMPHEPRVLATEQPLTIDLDNDFDTGPAELEPRPATRDPHLDGGTSDFQTVRADLPDDSGLIDFDLRDLTNSRSQAAADTTRGSLEPISPAPEEDPQSIKLSLARELQTLGDIDGARSLIEEVEAESTGELRAHARRMLSQLG